MVSGFHRGGGWVGGCMSFLREGGAQVNDWPFWLFRGVMLLQYLGGGGGERN